jgi:hypothetical protein
LWGSLITYENIECYHSGIVSRVRCCNVSGTESGQNFNCNRSAHRNAASRKSIDWSRLGQLGESAPSGERHWPEFRQRCRAAPVRARLGKIARNNGLNLRTLVSNAHRSSNATMHAKNTRTTHGKSGTHVAKGHGAKTNTARGGGHRSSGFSGSHGTRSMGHMSGSHGMRSMGHMSGSRGMGSMGHGGGRGR